MKVVHKTNEQLEGPLYKTLLAEYLQKQNNDSEEEKEDKEDDEQDSSEDGSNEDADKHDDEDQGGAIKESQTNPLRRTQMRMMSPQHLPNMSDKNEGLREATTVLMPAPAKSGTT